MVAFLRSRRIPRSRFGFPLICHAFELVDWAKRENRDIKLRSCGSGARQVRRREESGRCLGALMYRRRALAMANSCWLRKRRLGLLDQRLADHAPSAARDLGIQGASVGTSASGPSVVWRDRRGAIFSPIGFSTFRPGRLFRTPRAAVRLVPSLLAAVPAVGRSCGSALV